MPTKFYAVKIGIKTGIFRTWDQCKEIINGFKWAIYKSFPSFKEAENFLDDLKVKSGNFTENKNIRLKLPNIKDYKVSNVEKKIYSDGGCNKLTKSYAFGSVVDYKGIDLIKYNQDILGDFDLREVDLPVERRTVILANFNDCKTQQNNGAELLALVAALRISMKFIQIYLLNAGVNKSIQRKIWILLNLNILMNLFL